MKNLWILFSVTALLGCGGGAAQGATTSTDEETSGTESAMTPGEACVATMERERSCQSDFIPALVGLRVRMNQPAGIADRDASEGRDALVAEASTEYARDASDEAIAANCGQMGQIPAEQAQAWTSMMRECLAASDCASFVECDIRFTETRFSGGS